METVFVIITFKLIQCHVLRFKKNSATGREWWQLGFPSDPTAETDIAGRESPMTPFYLKAFRLESLRPKEITNPKKVLKSHLLGEHLPFGIRFLGKMSTGKELFQQGLKNRREVVGDAYVDRAIQNGSGEFAFAGQQLVTEYGMPSLVCSRWDAILNL